MIEIYSSAISKGVQNGIQAQILSDERCQKAVRKQSRLSQVPNSIVEFIHQSLTDRTSPEQICGQLKRQFKTSISHQTLYRDIWQDRLDGGSPVCQPTVIQPPV